jgi:uncharacterized protein YjbI with pentapeptide repeats
MRHEYADIMTKRSNIAKQLKAYYPHELLALYARGERNFAACNLLRAELEASFVPNRRFEQAYRPRGERMTSPLWLDRIFRADPDFEFDWTGRIILPETDGSPEEHDLSRTDLRNICFEGAYLYPINFSGANLSRSDLRRTIFIDCSFRGADLSRCDLRDAQFGNCDLCDTDLYMARMDRCVLTDCRAERTRLERSKLKRATFVGVDFRHADSSAHYDRTNFIGCDLRHVDLEGVDLRQGLFYENTIGASQIAKVLAILRTQVDSHA